MTSSVSASVSTSTGVSSVNKLFIRQDMKRSASVGNPQMVNSSTGPGSASGINVKPTVIKPIQQSLAASIAAIGVPSPRAKITPVVNSGTVNITSSVSRVASGTSYATALRTGAVVEDSETSVTDQLLIASLQSDILQVQSSSPSSNNILYGGLFTDNTTTSSSLSITHPNHTTSSVIERPPRSLSEPVIQLPQKMTPDYFKNQLSMIQGRGVAALGGAFNPVSPLQPMTTYGSMSPLQKAIRSPIMTALASPLSPLPSLGLAWLSTPPSQTNDATIDIPQITTSNGTNDFFPPLPPCNGSMTNSMANSMTNSMTINQQQQPQQNQQNIQNTRG